MLYILTIEVAPTVCGKEVNHPCPISNSENEKLTCIVKFWEQPWLGKRDIIKNTCTVSQEFTPKSLKRTTQVPKTTRSIDDVLSELDSQIIQTTPIADTNVKHDSSDSVTGNKPQQKIYSMYAPSYPYYVPPRFMYAWENLFNENQGYQNIENFPYQEDLLAQINDPVYRIRRSFNKNDDSDESKESNSNEDNIKYTHRHQHHCHHTSEETISKDDPHITFILNIGLQQLDDRSNYPNRYKVKEVLDVDKKNSDWGFMERESYNCSI